MCGPQGLLGQSDVCYRNEVGRFVEATEASSVNDPTRAYGLGVVAADYDDDGDVDLYVANDTFPNFLYDNDGSGTFTESGLLSGAAYNASGAIEAGMGVDFGDPNGDGRLDVFVTNFSHETNTLYLGSDSGLFTDATDEHGLGTPSLGRLGWGARFVDFDQDGDVYPNVTESDDTTSYRQQNQVFLNRGDGVFEERTVDAESPSRGVAFGDVDGDGDVDVVVTNIDEAPSLLRNDVETGHWIGVTLVGRESNRDANGARVRVTAGARTQVKEAHASGSVFSSSDPRVHFGLGNATSVDELSIRWPGGKETTLTNVGADRYLLVVETTAPP